MKPKTLLLVLSAPSGGGKSTICELLLRGDRRLQRSISATTRLPRGQEREGRDYYFFTSEEFARHKRAGRFLEWAKVHNHYYGTLKSEVQRRLRSGKDVILVIDVQGGLTVKQHHPEAVLIFIQPPSLRDLEQRLRKRGTDSGATIAVRMRHARWEITQARQYDYMVLNQRLAAAVKQVHAIILAERLRVSRSLKSRKG